MSSAASNTSGYSPILVERSLRILTAGQRRTGAFVASPDFPPYRYCWLRDGSFIAYALDRWGEHHAAARFHRWVDRTIASRKVALRTLVENSRSRWDTDELLPARFEIDGQDVENDWPSRGQLDGYGTWLWAFCEHIRLTNDSQLAHDLAASVEAVSSYVEAYWPHHCFDCWEEDGGTTHPSTLACLYGGLVAVASADGRESAARAGRDIARFVQNHVRDGVIPKSIGSHDVDASALWLAVPFSLLEADDPIVRATVSVIAPVDGSKGVRRYLKDTFYGGGNWPLLTAWLGWYDVRVGRQEDGWECLRWIENTAAPDGSIPEQVGGESRDPLNYRKWVQRWGMPARQLLWSHAMYLILAAELTSQR